MYTILMNNDGTLYGSKKCMIMQRDKLFDKLWILIPPHYHGHDMSKCTVTMRYILPISKTFKTETLVLSNDKYEEYLKYVLPIDTNLTKECGDVKLNLTFTMLDVDADGNIIQRVKKTNDYVLKITPLPDYDAIIPDEALSALDQRILKQDAQILKQDAQIKALESLANVFDGNIDIVDNLVYDEINDTLQLSAKGVGVGNKVSVRDMMDEGIPVVDLDFDIGQTPDNDFECEEDNVVEF